MGDKILIVDDDIETLRLVGLMLQRQGYEIAAANNGAQALGQVARDHPNLILLDVMLTDTDGYEVTRRLRKDPQTMLTSILMFTARSQREPIILVDGDGMRNPPLIEIQPESLLSQQFNLLAGIKDQ